jgi:hypothetical protein
MNQFWRPPLLLCLVINVAGCGGVPKEALTSYSAVYQEAHKSGLLIYEQMEPALRRADASEGAPVRTTAYVGSLGPSAINRTDCPGRFAEFPELAARCFLLSSVSRYNSALLELASGSSTRAVHDQVQRGLRSALGLAALVPVPQVAAALPVAVAASKPIEGIFASALELYDAARVRAKLDEGAPVIEMILTTLQADAERIYSVQREYYVLLLGDSEDEVTRALRPLKVRAEARALSDDAAVALARQALDDHFDRIFAPPEPAPTFRLRAARGSPGAQLLSGSDLAFMDQQLGTIEAQAAAFAMHVGAWQRFRDALMAYDGMLENVQTSFTALRLASGDPFTAGGAADQFAAAATRVRENAREIRTLLNVDRNPRAGGV